MNKKPFLCIWDIDNTLYDGYCIIDFGEFLEKKGVFMPGFKDDMDTLKHMYKTGEINYEEFASSVYRTYGEYIEDQNLYKILQISKEFWKYNITKIFPFAINFMEQMNSKGAEHAAISGSSFESLYYLLDYLGFIRMKATEYETIDGNFTSKLVSTLVSHFDKKKLVDRVIRQKNKYEITVGLGDNFADTAFLHYVDVPIVVGKRDELLLKVAKEKKWIVVEDPYLDRIDLRGIGM